MTSSPGSPPEVKQGSLAAAIDNGRQLLKRDPALALAQAHAILRRDDRNVDALRLAAAAHRLRGEELDSQRAELTAIQHSQSDPTLKRAAKALDEGKPLDASRIASEHLRRTPDDLAARTVWAEAAIALGLAEKAESALREVLKRAPQFAPAEALLVSALIRQDKLKDARQRLETREQERRAKVEDLRLLARVQSDLRDYDAAAATYERLFQAGDEKADVWTSYGDTLRFLGRPVESRLAYERALSLDPSAGLTWWSLVNLDPAAVTDEQLQRIRDALAARAEEPEHASHLHFALGQALDARQLYPEAFEHFSSGNALRKAGQRYDPDALTREIDRAIQILTPEFIATEKRGESGSPEPIFIIGMPRSGSTLIERILGEHSAIEALGELPIVPHLIEASQAEAQRTHNAPRSITLTSKRLVETGIRYVERASERRQSTLPYFTDKLHMNWHYLPLILRMLPDVKIIDVRRSPMDCCWSNYKMPFGPGHPSASSLNWIGRFYRDYVRMMDTIEKVAPGRILCVVYEDLIDDPQGQATRMLEYLGLQFEPECLEFHRSAALVATASSEQVRRPLNREGMSAWKPYAEWLGPLRAALGPLAGT
ncbi:MAG: tetratricopeptide repeat-containing sulfotransferase family protein [Sphingomicrobium sp.]